MPKIVKTESLERDVRGNRFSEITVGCVVGKRTNVVSVRSSFREECFVGVMPFRFDISLEQAGRPASKEAPPFLVSFPDNLELAGFKVDGGKLQSQNLGN